MPNKRIQDLPKIDRLTSGDILPLGRASAAYDAYGVTGQQLTDFIKDEAQPFVDKAEQAATEAEASKTAAAQSATQANAAKEAAELSKTGAEAAKKSIEDMTVSSQEVSADQPIAVEKTVVDGIVNLLFKLKAGPTGAEGPKGDPGNSIQKIERTSGNGAPGTTDTYTITLTDGSTYTFQVYNGQDGTGAGDMEASVYDPTGKRLDIYKYTDDAIKNIPAREPLNFGAQTSGQAFTVTTEQMADMLSDTPPDVAVDMDGITLTLRRYDKTQNVAYYSNVMYSQGKKHYVTMQAMGTSATITDTEEIQIPTPEGAGDNKKFLQANEAGGFDLVTAVQAGNPSTEDLDGKIDTVTPATAGNLPTLTADGQLRDSGKSLDDLGSNDFEVTITGEAAGPFSADKTFSEIEDALAAGKRVFVTWTTSTSKITNVTLRLFTSGASGKAVFYGSFFGYNVGLVEFSISASGEVTGNIMVTHEHKATEITDLAGTDYTISRVRGIALSTSTPGTIPNGCLVGVYE